MWNPLPRDRSARAVFSPGVIPPLLTPIPWAEIPDRGAQGSPLKEAFLAAVLSHIAYHPEAKVPRYLEHYSFELVRVLHAGAVHARLLRDENGGDWIVFRGTVREVPGTIAADLDCLLSTSPCGRVHRGIWRAFTAARPELERVAGGRLMAAAGHSLGGALALLASREFGIPRCLTFGAPRMGDGGAAAALVQGGVSQFILSRDIVPRLPPSLLGFSAPHGALYISDDDRLHARRSVPGSAGMQGGRLMPRFLTDHSIVNYSIALFNALGARSSF